LIASSWSPSSESICPIIRWYSEFVGFFSISFFRIGFASEYFPFSQRDTVFL
jgi:hypothetical protein